MMALTIEQNVTIDVLNPRRNIIHVVQEDSTRVIRLTLLANNLPYNVEATETETVLKFVEFRKPDGHGGMYDTTSTGETAVQLEDSNVPNVWLIALDGQCFTFPGWTQINIRFETESGRRIHTFPIFVDVSPTASSDTESTDWGELNSIGDLKAAVGALFEATMSADAKQALMNLLAHVAYTDEHGQDYYDELETELFRTAGIVSISAVFDQGSAVIYDTDDLDTLRQYLTVTATYEDLSEREITGYTLSGTLTEGTSAITVSYAGKTATFDVTVTHSLVPAGFTKYDYITLPDAHSSAPNSNWLVLKQYENMNVLSTEFAFKPENGHSDGTAVFGMRVSGTSGAASSYALYAKIGKLSWQLHGTSPASDALRPDTVEDSVNYVYYQNTDQSPSSLKTNDNQPIEVAWTNNNVLNIAPMLFSNPNSTTANLGAKIQCGYIKFFALDGTLVSHYVPAVRESDNRIGMYDAIGQIFYTPSNSAVATIGDSGQWYEVGNWS